MSKKKILTLVLALALIATCAISGTVAWLIDEEQSIANTFTIGDIDIELKDATISVDTFVPGDAIAVNSNVVVKANSEDCYLFIKVTDTNNDYSSLSSTKAIQWAVNTAASEWKQVPGLTDYWYREVAKTSTDKICYIFKGDVSNTNGQFTVSKDVTKAMVQEMKNEKMPVVSIAAAAIQEKHINDVVSAFNELPESFRGTDNAIKNN